MRKHADFYDESALSALVSIPWILFAKLLNFAILVCHALGLLVKFRFVQPNSAG